MTQSPRSAARARGAPDSVQAALDAAEIGMWEWDVGSGEVTWSPTLERIHGFEPGEFARSFDLYQAQIHPEDREGVLSAIRAAVEGVAAYQVEYRMYRKDGSLHWVSARGTVLRDEEGRPVRMIGVCMDITPRREVERELREQTAALQRSEERYRSLTEATAQIVFTVSPAGRMREGLAEWAELTGTPLEELSEENRWLEALHPEDRDRVLEGWRRSFAETSPFSSEYRLRHRDGTYRWVGVRTIPVREGDGTLREWIGAIADIDERRRSEQGLRILARSHEVFAESLDVERTLGNLTRVLVPELADWCVVDLTVDGGKYERVVVAHPDPRKEAMARELREKYPPKPEADLVGQAIRTGAPILLPRIEPSLLQAAAVNEEHLQILEQLQLRSAMIVPLVARGRTLGAITVVAAESERSYDARDLEFMIELARRASLAIDNARLYEQAQEANRAKDEFLATLSHELRTPLTSILGWARLLGTELDPATAREAIDTIQRSAVLQARLIDDVLDVSRIIRGKMRIQVTEVDLGASCVAAVDTMRPAAAARELQLSVELDDAPKVQGDPNRIQQILYNLLSNAIKFTPRGGAVRLRLENAGSHVRVVVSDTGRGIAPEFLPHVFEPFRQYESSSTRSHTGLGLGLAIVRYLTELHGGSVSAFSEGPGRGATFTVEFPQRTRLEAGSAPAWVAEPDLDSPPPARFPDLSGVRIMIVDDQPDARRLLSSVLTRCGARTSVAESVAEARALLAAEPPDVLVSDIAMPLEDGYALIREWRAGERQGRLPALAVTAFGTPEDERRALEAGFDAWIRKPVEPLDFARTVAGMVRPRI